LTSEQIELIMPSNQPEGGPDSWSILAHLWQLIQSVMDDSAPSLEGLGMSPKAFFVLAAVEEYPFPAALARRMHLPPPTVTYLVKQLEERGFLRRQPEPGDLRRFRLVVTAAGHEAIRQGRQAVGVVLDRRLGRLDRGDIDAFDRVVSRLAGPATGSPTEDG
jgi:DNA-binding MarR family transcriptional regulator